MEKKISIISYAVGIIFAVLGAMMMFHGNIFSENNTGIAIVMGVIGLCLISTSPHGLLKMLMK